MLLTTMTTMRAPIWLLLITSTANATPPSPTPGNLPFSMFSKTCFRSMEQPLDRFWGTRVRPDANMINHNDLWDIHDPNLAILPKWDVPHGANKTMPFMDTLSAVRLLGGVSPYNEATGPSCYDHDLPGKKDDIWCDLAVRNATGGLTTRVDLLRSRLDRWVDAGMAILVVLDNVPWAFINKTNTGPCENYGCQYQPPDDDKIQEFATWVGELAGHIRDAYGMEFASRLRFRLGTEANGPRWGMRGSRFNAYMKAYKAVAAALHSVLPSAQFGASNWNEGQGHSGGLNSTGYDNFQYNFYSQVHDDDSIPVDFIALSHYGRGHTVHANMPGADFVQRTTGSGAPRGPLELQAMRSLANRPNATLELQEFGILTNEAGESSFEPSSVGTAWATVSATAWMCNGVDRLFHWESGTILAGRNFYEQWPWSMALLELFKGGRASFTLLELPEEKLKKHSMRAQNNSIGVIDSVVQAEATGMVTYYAMIGAIASTRDQHWSTTVELSSDAFSSMEQPQLTLQQYRMNSTVSATETVLRELKGQAGMLQEDDGLPYDFKRMLTSQGMAYAEKNIDRLWKMHASTFQPSSYEGTWQHDAASGQTTLRIDVSSASVTVVSVTATATFSSSRA